MKRILLAVILFQFCLIAIANPVDSVAVDSLPDVELNEIVVSHQNIKQEGDRTIITVDNEMKRGAVKAGDLLGRVPGAYYDPVSTEISYLGSKNVVVLVDSLERNVDYIKRLNVERFDRIDVIRQPSGKYDGYDALINLHTRPLYTGYDGNIFATTALAPEAPAEALLREFTTVAEFTYTREKINFEIDGGYRRVREGGADYYDRSYPLNGVEERTIEQPRGIFNRNLRNDMGYANGAFDWQINQSNSVSARYMLIVTDANVVRNNPVAMTSGAGMRPDTVGVASSERYHDVYDHKAGLYYRGSTGAWNYNASVGYVRHTWGFDRRWTRTSGYRQDDLRDMTQNYMWADAAVSTTGAGNKLFLDLTYRLIVSSFNEKRPVSGQLLSKSDDVRNTLLASARYVPSQRFSMGLKAGFSVLKNKIVDYKATHTSPRVGAWVSASAADWLYTSVNYDCDYTSPGLTAVQDYGQFTDSLRWGGGNPALAPAITHNASVNLMIKRRLMVYGRISYSDGKLSTIYRAAEGMRPDGVYGPYVTSIIENTSYRSIVAGVNYNTPIKRNFEAGIDGQWAWNHAAYDGWSASKSAPVLNWYFKYFTDANDFQAVLSYSLDGMATVTPQQITWGTEDRFGVSVTKWFLRNRLMVMAMYLPPLHLVRGNHHSQLRSEGLTETQWYNTQYISDNFVSLTVTYKFSGGHSVRNYKRNMITVE